MRIVKLTKETTENILENMLKRSPTQYGTYEASVQEIIENVKTRKDAAVFEYTEKFDHAVLDASTVEVTQEEIDEAYNIVDPELIGVIRRSMKNIREFHEKQKQNSWFTSTENGTMLGQKLTALNRVGVYVPGGKAAYPSSVLMNILPAKVAGVKEICMTTPCGRDGKVNPVVLAAAKEAGADRVFKIGGAQAIAAFAYGTESIPKVDKIVGPGNIYVAPQMARRQQPVEHGGLARVLAHTHDGHGLCFVEPPDQLVVHDVHALSLVFSRFLSIAYREGKRKGRNGFCPLLPFCLIPP